jgi:hypothetical protein
VFRKLGVRAASGATSSFQAPSTQTPNALSRNGLQVDRSDGVIALQTLAAELDAVNESSAKPHRSLVPPSRSPMRQTPNVIRSAWMSGCLWPATLRD